jgi:pimeloyl-ACP methyl ester carboxylesterase
MCGASFPGNTTPTKSKVESFTPDLIPAAVTMSSETEHVILLHGLARTDRSMHKLGQALQKEGYSVHNVGYTSTRDNIETLAEESVGRALAACSAAGKVHFVTHSLGGILVRHYLRHHQIDNLGRVVMLGPPNKGSEVVDKLRDFPGFYFLNGDAGLELGTGATSVPNSLGEANFDLGVIAGTRSVNLILSRMIPGTNDGKVSVENTRLEGMNDHLEMEVTHPFMMRNSKVIDQVIHYLQSGSFRRESDA